jgi:hypothetical protein
MRYRGLTQDRDYRFGEGPSEFLVNSPACVAQAVLTALLLHRGEWFLDTTVGMPWETQVLGYNTQSLYDAAIKSVILGVEGVDSIVTYSSTLNRATRALLVAATLNTIYGRTLVKVNLSGGYGIGPFGEVPYGGGG